jgi:hypothetical protein
MKSTHNRLGNEINSGYRESFSSTFSILDSRYPHIGSGVLWDDTDSDFNRSPSDDARKISQFGGADYSSPPYGNSRSGVGDVGDPMKRMTELLGPSKNTVTTFAFSHD